MSDIEIFAIGFFTFVLVGAGLAFTIYEVPKIHEEAERNLQARRKYGSSVPRVEFQVAMPAQKEH